MYQKNSEPITIHCSVAGVEGLEFSHCGARSASALTVHRTVIHSRRSVQIPQRFFQHNKKAVNLSVHCPYLGGEEGIRTPETLLTPTRFPIVRLRPAQPPLRNTIILYIYYGKKSRLFLQQINFSLTRFPAVVIKPAVVKRPKALSELSFFG